MTVSFYSAFLIATEVAYLQRYLVVTWLVPGETAAIILIFPTRRSFSNQHRRRRCRVVVVMVVIPCNPRFIVCFSFPQL